VKTETWKAKEQMAAEPGGGSEDHAGRKMMGEGGVQRRMGERSEGGQAHPRQ
jgi:hypothetical protein